MRAGEFEADFRRVGKEPRAFSLTAVASMLVFGTGAIFANLVTRRPAE